MLLPHHLATSIAICIFKNWGKITASPSHLIYYVSCPKPWALHPSVKWIFSQSSKFSSTVPQLQLLGADSDTVTEFLIDLHGLIQFHVS